MPGDNAIFDETYYEWNILIKKYEEICWMRDMTNTNLLRYKFQFIKIISL